MLAMVRMKALHSAPQLEPQSAPLLVTHSAPHSERASERESARTTAPRSDCTYNQLLLAPWSALKLGASAPS